MIQQQKAKKEKNYQFQEALLDTQECMQEAQLAKQEWNQQFQADGDRLLAQGSRSAPTSVFPAEVLPGPTLTNSNGTEAFLIRFERVATITSWERSS